MKRMGGSDDDDDDLHLDKGVVVKDYWGRRNEESGSTQRSASSVHRSCSSYYSKFSDTGRKALSSPRSRYDRFDDGKDVSRKARRQSDYDAYQRRRGYDRQQTEGVSCTDHLYRSESLSGSRREFTDDFRYRPKREGVAAATAASWRRFGSWKDGEDGGRKEVGKAKSPRGTRDAKSPAWSKDSGSEHSKSVDSRKCVDESIGPGSEREEGELEPDHQTNVSMPKPITDNAASANSSEKDVPVEDQVDSKLSQEEAVNLPAGNKDENTCRLLENAEDVTDKNGSPGFRDKSSLEAVGSTGKGSWNRENDFGDNVLDSRDDAKYTEDSTKNVENTTSLPEETDDKGFKGQVKEDADVLTVVETEISLTERKTNQISEYNGKGVALLPSDPVQFSETSLEFEGGTRDLQKSGDIGIEGSTSRGFQFFSTDPVNKVETVEQLSNPKDDKLALELSLSLPNVLLPIGSQSRAMDPGSPSQTRSFHSFASSFRTMSDGFTGSVSFSGSQHFTHNPSCSLTHNMPDNEQSVKSRPLFQGVDWKALSSDENKSKDYANGEAMVQYPRVSSESSKQPIGFDRELSFSEHLSSGLYFGSSENGLEYSKGRRKFIMETDNGFSQRCNTHDGEMQVRMVGSDFAESVATMVVSEPINAMSQKFNEMSPEQLAVVKEFIYEMIPNPAKQWRLSSFQNTLLKRQDISLDMLLNAHRSQLEIFVAIKTGLKEFIHKKCDIPTSELAEIFLNMRCRNLKCRSLLPVDECDCQICTRMSDFCRECMCLVCSKFDNAENTCSWVGCDVCLHWCHADCGLRESHIRNGCQTTGGVGTEVHFYCVACGHPSEMFGFVKEVFQNFVNEWTAEKLSQELEYVRRIFCHSEDARGKQVHELAVQMKSKLADRTDIRNVQKLIMKFFSESSTVKLRDMAVEPMIGSTLKVLDNMNGHVGSSRGTAWLKSCYNDGTPILENDKYVGKFKDMRKMAKETATTAAIDEIESIVRIKVAEANMFQARADDARRDSESLKRISISKKEKIEEEYNSRISRLRLAESEEAQKRKIEELQVVDRDYQEYFNMKMRMESDIKELLLIMEAKRRNLAT